MNSKDHQAPTRQGWDDRFLFRPLNTLSARSQALVISMATLLTLGWSAWSNGNLEPAWTLPDVRFYVLMAQGRISEVPAPFSARPLAPLLAHFLATLTHTSVHVGFTVLAYASLLISMAVVFFLMVRSAAPRWTVLLIAAVPFWPLLLGEVGLPDPLYTVLLALFLVALELDLLAPAAVLLFPLMLARESTWLTLLCLLAVSWRRLGWRLGALAGACAAAGSVVVKHLSAGGLPNPEHLSGGLYMIGKLAANSARSSGIVPWSNVYPELCGTPVWQHALALGKVQSVGVCSLSPNDPLRVLGTVLFLFGILPLLTFTVWLTSRFPFRRTSLLVRFCLLYGGVSFLVAPALGTWYVRLFGYGWPLFLVALPRLLGDVERQPLASGKTVWGALILVQLLMFAWGQTHFGYRDVPLMAVLELAWVALFMVQRRSRRSPGLPGGSGPSAW